MDKARINSPLGSIEIIADSEGILSILFTDENSTEEIQNVSALISTCITQLNAYFEGKLTVFDLRLKLNGTAFQQSVWNELTRIPFAKTISYLELAQQLGDEKSIRAAASANGKNMHAIVIPCHRVIGTDGSLTGYAGGLWRKKWLLEHEKKVAGEAVQGELW